MWGKQRRAGPFPHGMGQASGDLGLLSQSGSCSQSAPGPSLPMLHFLAKGPLPQHYGHFPQEAQWCSNLYLGQVLLECLQGEDHGGSYSPVIMPGETEQGVRATVAAGP